jgi:NAD(P)H dehydrogenase (quinone)
MKVLIVHAHHEPKSFSSALYAQAAKTLSDQGHEVVTSDLYGQGFDPVSDRRNFVSVHDSEYLKQQVEEQYASQVRGFAPDLDAEIRKLESCDLLLFNFPMWWFGLPAILKGWVDRAFPMRRIYGDGKLYENGLGQAKKRAMVIMTVGAGEEAYGGFGVNPSLESILAPIQHGIFWFNGFLPLAPFVAWKPVRIGPEGRAAYLAQLDQRLRSVAREEPYQLPLLSDFPGFGKDTKKRFMVVVTRNAPADERYQLLIPAESARIAELKRSGVVLSSAMGSSQTQPWKGFLVIRETDAEKVQGHLDTLPLAQYLDFDLTELTQLE